MHTRAQPAPHSRPCALQIHPIAPLSQIRDYRPHFLEYARVDTERIVMPAIRRKVLRPTHDVVLAEVLEAVQSSTQNEEPMSRFVHQTEAC